VEGPRSSEGLGRTRGPCAAGAVDQFRWPEGTCQRTAARALEHECRDSHEDGNAQGRERRPNWQREERCNGSESAVRHTFRLLLALVVLAKLRRPATSEGEKRSCAVSEAAEREEGEELVQTVRPNV
jgi:hypothetical protein